jgi:hypothetical protein
MFVSMFSFSEESGILLSDDDKKLVRIRQDSSTTSKSFGKFRVVAWDGVNISINNTDVTGLNEVKKYILYMIKNKNHSHK